MCFYRFGSWRQSSGWTWNEEDDPLLSLFLDNGSGIIGGFNASTREYERCRILNVTSLTKTGVWGNTDFDSKNIIFFPGQGYHHISWVS